MISLGVTLALMAVGTAILSANGDPTLGISGLAAVLWRNLVVAGLLGALGVCVGAVVRNQTVAVVGVLIAGLALEPTLMQVAPDVGRFGPVFGATGGINAGATVEVLGLVPALAVSSAWLAATFVAAATLLHRRDLAE